MRHGFKISMVACLAAMLATPAGAAAINLGGDGGLINLGGGDDSGGGGGGLLGLGGSGGSGGGGGLLGLGGSGGDGGSAATLNTGDVFSNSDDVNTATVGDDAATVDVNPGTAGNGTLLDLFGTGGDDTNAPTTAKVRLGGSDGTTANTLVDLFGTDDDNPDAAVNLSGAGSGLLGTGADSDVTLDLFGNGGGSGSGTGGGSGGGGINGGGSINAGTTGSVSVASLDMTGSANCFTPNAKQVARLASRHAYTSSMLSSLDDANHMKIVRVGLCDASADTIDNNPNIGRLQAYLATQPELRSELRKQGLNPGDVIAVDKNGTTLVVYVV